MNSGGRSWRVLVSAGVLLAACAIPTRADGQPRNYLRGKMSEAQLRSEFGPAILQVELKEAGQAGFKKMGTAFLVDAEGGYLLTAGHVIDPVLRGNPREIYVSSDTQPERKLKAEVVAGTVDPVDAALLRLVDPTALRGVNPVDISLQLPNADVALYAIGYPDLFPGENAGMRMQLVNYSNLRRDRNIEVRQAAYGGNSGGPLLDETGAARGICLQKHGVSEPGVGAQFAAYLPMYRLQTLLARIPLTKRIHDLDARVRQAGISQSDLGDQLVMSSRTPSNVELFGWGWQILRKLPEYQKARPLLRNPLLRAFMQRGLEDLVIGFSAVSDPGDLGEANLSLARRAEAGGDILGSLSFGQAAQDAFALTDDVSSQAEATLLVAFAQLKAGNRQKAGDNLKAVLKHYDALSPGGKGQYFAVAAQVAAENHKYNQASGLFEKAVAHYMGQNAILQAGDVHAVWAGTKVSSGDIPGAQQQLQQAIALSADDPSRQADYLYELASVQVSGGDPDDARQTLERFLAIAPDDDRAKEVKTMLKDKSAAAIKDW